MTTELLSARLPKEDIFIIEAVSEEEKTDKTTALKKLLSLGAKKYKLDKSIKAYREGKISIGKAAETAGISLWEMMDELKAKNIANPLTKEDYKEGLKNLEKL
ncbi:MAG: UPF0175 family protein [archaeon]